MRIIRFLYLFQLLKLGIHLPTFNYIYGNENSTSNIWKHSKRWRFNWERY